MTLEISAGSGVTWIINGKDIPTGKLTDLSLKVDTKANTIPVTVINTVTGEQKVMQLALSHNGAFGFSLTLRLDAGKDNTGLFANLLEVADWAISAFQWDCGAGVVSGTSETTLSPQAGATRAQLAAILQQMARKARPVVMDMCGVGPALGP